MKRRELLQGMGIIGVGSISGAVISEPKLLRVHKDEEVQEQLAWTWKGLTGQPVPDYISETEFQAKRDQITSIRVPSSHLRAEYTVTVESGDPITFGVYEGNLMLDGEASIISMTNAEYGKPGQGSFTVGDSTDLMFRFTTDDEGSMSRGRVETLYYGE